MWVERLQDKLEAAVIRQMVSDVPIGISLSSGVDSTTLLAIMKDHSNGPVCAFTVGFTGKEKTSEVGIAQKTASRFGAKFHKLIISAEDYAGFMAKYLWHLEEPIGNESSAAYYFVAEMARQHGVKVLLNGQGADEAFAGYGRYLYAAYSRMLRFGALKPFPQLLPLLLGGTALGERYERFLYTLGGRDETDRFLRVYSIMPEAAKRFLLHPDLRAHYDNGLPLRYLREQLARAPEGTALERMTYIDARTSLPDNLLLCEDKMAMAASIEARVPLLDLEYMSVAEQIPGKFKLRGLQDKYIHREACKRWVGEEIIARPKIGFDNAMDLWLRKQLGEHIRQIIESSSSFTRNYLNLNHVSSLMKEHLKGHRNHQRILFLLLSLESWYSVFMKKK